MQGKRQYDNYLAGEVIGSPDYSLFTTMTRNACPSTLVLNAYLRDDLQATVKSIDLGT